MMYVNFIRNEDPQGGSKISLLTILQDKKFLQPVNGIKLQRI